MSDKGDLIQSGWVICSDFALGRKYDQDSLCNSQSRVLESSPSPEHGKHEHDNDSLPSRGAPLEQPDSSSSLDCILHQVGHRGEFSGLNVRLYTFGEGDEPVSIDSLDPQDVGHLWLELRVSESMSRNDVDKWFRRLEKSLRKGLDGENTLVVVMWHRAKHMEWVARQVLEKLDRRGIEATWLAPVEVPRQDRSHSRDYTSDPQHRQSDRQSSNGHENPDDYHHGIPARSERRHGRYFGR